MVVSLFLEFFPLPYPSLFLLSCSGFCGFQVKEIQFKIVKLKRVVTGRKLGPLTESVEGAVPRHGSEVRDLVPQLPPCPAPPLHWVGGGNIMKALIYFI